MCGIVGIFSSNTSNYQNKKKLFSEMLFSDTLRGYDSTGLFYVTKHGFADYYKKALAGYDFLQLKMVDKILTNIEQYPFIIGHNRWATQGAVNNKNAHPFNVGDITLVHNGTLRSYTNLPDWKEFSVDSEAIANAIDTLGAEQAIPKLNGAFALVWYDDAMKTLNVCRNKERPLVYAHAEIEGTNKEVKTDVIIASEYKMIYWLADRNGYKVKEIYDFTPGDIYSFKKEDVTKPTRKTIELYKEPVGPLNFSNGYRQTGGTNNPGGGGRNYVNKTLERLNFKVDEKFLFEPESFEFYNKNSEWGYAVATMTVEVPGKTTEVVEFRCSGMTYKEYKDLYHGKQFTCRISGGKEADIVHDEPVVIYCADPKVVKEEPAAILATTSSTEKKTKYYTVNGKTGFTLQQWDNATKQGCAWCSNMPDEKDADTLVWLDGATFMCHDCAEEAHRLGVTNVSQVAKYLS